jgi:hypothetical protein
VIDPIDEEFNRIEMESRIKQEYVRAMTFNEKMGAGKSVAMPDYLNLMEELAVARMLIRELGDRLAKLEKPWVGLTFQEQQEAMLNTHSFHEALIKAEKRLKEKNNG